MEGSVREVPSSTQLSEQAHPLVVALPDVSNKGRVTEGDEKLGT
jgi:hypothetical protein